jgi:Reverse transcriptase (RNA-dependent DNA polymerase)
MITHTPLILQEFNTFYRNLLGTPTPNLQRPNLEAIYPPPNTDYLRSLVDPITLHEIREAMFSLPKDKANGLDRFPIEFFQRYWEWVSLDLLSTITAFYHKKLDLWRINQAYITLIPKKANSVTPSDYRPISVLSAIPKIITKILATRLQPFLKQLIHNNQTTFVKGRQLMQTFLSTRETLTYLARKNIPSIFLKIDFQKAFDSI